MNIKSDVVLREIAGDYVLVPTGTTVVKYNGLFGLSEVAARIWELIPECDTEKEISDKIYDEFDCERSVVEADVAEFIAKLRDMELID